MEELRERLKKFHEEQGVSYKIIAKEVGVSTGVMYNFTSEIRGLKEHAVIKLNQYLAEKGY